MNNFTFYAPTYFAFGKDTQNQAGALVKRFGGTKVLVHFGGGSVVRSGLLDTVKASLEAEGLAYVELGGVKPNPRSGLVYEGIELCRKEGVDFVLAVGGGSTIDSAKAIAAGTVYDGDFWDFYEGKPVEKALPVGTILTIAAAGSEGSPDSVITKEEGMIKRGASGEAYRPKFSILNPALTQTLPPYQTAAGITDMMMHTMERYFSHDDDMDLTDRIAEALLRSMRENAYKVLADPEDYRARAQVMWGGSLAHNDLTGCGLTGDWATHELEHELSGMFDVTHGAGLAAIWPSWARYVYKENVSRFVRFAVKVMGVPQDFTDPEGTALKGIAAMERFYHDIGMPVNIRELIGREITETEIQEMVRKCSRNYTVTQGQFKVLRPEDMAEIYRMAR